METLLYWHDDTPIERFTRSYLFHPTDGPIHSVFARRFLCDAAPPVPVRKKLSLVSETTNQNPCSSTQPRICQALLPCIPPLLSRALWSGASFIAHALLRLADWLAA